MSIIAQDEHLDETPTISFLFAAITAVSNQQIKSLTTTLTNAVTILEEGYEFHRHNPCYYLVTSPVEEKINKRTGDVKQVGGEVYNLAYDPSLGVASCSCHANANLGTCKHIVGLHLHKAKIDELHDKRVADTAAIEAARLQEEAAAESLRLETEKTEAEAQATRETAPAFWTRTTQRPVCSDENGTFTVIAGWDSWGDFWRETDAFMASRATEPQAATA